MPAKDSPTQTAFESAAIPANASHGRRTVATTRVRRRSARATTQRSVAIHTSFGRTATSIVRLGRLSTDHLIAGDRQVFAVGTWTEGRTATTQRELARLDIRGRLLGVTPLPAGPLGIAFGGPSLWAARREGSSVERIDGRTGRIVEHLRAEVGIALAFADSRLWTVTRDGVLRQLP